MKKKWYLGKTKDKPSERVYIEDFSWDCGWYWGGGYISTKNMFTQFNSCFLKVPDSRGHMLGNFFDPWTKIPDYLGKDDYKTIKNGASIWEDLGFFLDDPQYNKDEWWIIKGLFDQFYKLRDAAEVFRSGNRCKGGPNKSKEINLDLYKQINDHIEAVIIPAIRKALNKELNKE